MLVNSIPFWIFFPIVIIPYYFFFRNSSKAQNVWLLFASYFFYGYAEIKMIPIILIATIVFYFLGIQIQKDNAKNPNRSYWFTTFGVLLGVGMLVYFKYLNFLIEEFAAFFDNMGIHTNMSTFKILMPLGISYFTFKLISYVIEIHREKMGATRDPIAFALFVSFFPTIMAGPIDRPNEFIPQLNKQRLFQYDGVIEGCKRILWGMFLKMCIADQLTSYVDAVYSNYSFHNTSSIILASICYFFQAYTDFCGYSHMAVGVSSILGISIRENFKRPLFAQNITELWRRWHMSLTTWITDYVFIPLNIKFRDWGVWGLYLATFINMIIVGAWHGANWTFVIFGFYHGFLMCMASAIERPRKKIEKKYNLKKKAYWIYPRIIFTWFLFGLGTMLFRSDSIGDYIGLVCQMESGLGMPFVDISLYPAFLSLLFMLIQEYWVEKGRTPMFLNSKYKGVRIISFAMLALYIIYMGNFTGGAFIYFQF